MVKNFFFFGDSICVGQLISPHKTWVVKCSSRINKIYPKIIVQNCSVSGDTTSMGLQRMDYGILKFGIDFIVIQFGINDCNLWKTMNGAPRVSEMLFKANLSEMVDLSRRFGAKKIILNTNHLIPKEHKFFTGQAFQERNAVYNDIIRDVSIRKETLLIDIEEKWLSIDPEEYLLPDCIHLNEDGHDLYYNTVINTIIKEIKI